MFVVGRARFNELSIHRRVGTFYHFHAITLRIVLNFIHDVVDKQNAAAGRLEEIRGIARVGNLLHIESFAFVFNCETGFTRRKFGGDPHEFIGIVLVAMLDGVNKSLIESDEEI